MKLNRAIAIAWLSVGDARDLRLARRDYFLRSCHHLRGGCRGLRQHAFYQGKHPLCRSTAVVVVDEWRCAIVCSASA